MSISKQAFILSFESEMPEPRLVRTRHQSNLNDPILNPGFQLRVKTLSCILIRKIIFSLILSEATDW